MRFLTTIQSRRKTVQSPSFKIVYEWEDILAELLGLKIKSDSEWWNKYYRRYENNGLVDLYNYFLPTKDLHIDFIMTASPKKLCRINKNTIPVIIDFWLKEEEIDSFFNAYKNVPLLLLTNLEVYELLKKHNCPIPIEHWPLSYPDTSEFSQEKIYEKTYEFCLFGRPNPFFVRMQEEYACRHPDFVYLKTKGIESDRKYYTNKGDFVCEDSGRESYLNMIRKTRITCYSTPGIDEGKKETTSFNQVTPRLFEMLCNGCQVIGHYPTNGSDVKWYNLSSIVPNINNYEEFEKILDEMRKKTIDSIKIENFMNKHYTSKRAQMLITILKKHNIALPINGHYE